MFYGLVDLDPAVTIAGGRKTGCRRGEVGTGAIDFAFGPKRWDTIGRRGFGYWACAAKREARWRE